MTHRASFHNALASPARGERVQPILALLDNATPEQATASPGYSTTVFGVMAFVLAVGLLALLLVRARYRS